MKNNWYTNINIDKVIYDGTARTGRDSDDIVRLFIEKLFVRTKEDRLDILQEIEDRQINDLVHFTRAPNVSQIFKYGLIPREYLERKPLIDLVKGPFPDDKRLENMRDSNCISVSFPNYRMFFKKRKEFNDDWGVVIINPDILSKCPCFFFKKNAASRIEGDKSCQAFKDMFENYFVHEYSKFIRDHLKTPINYTTDPQAEILVNSVIPPRYIRGVFVEKWPVKVLIEKKAGNKYKEKIWISNKYFRPRDDYEHWKS